MSNQKIKEPLVSVCIITYNSAEFILDALNSVYEQTYRNIELIISDDCSKDDTIQVCEKWLAGHRNRFTNTIILNVKKNTGVCANLNRAIKSCQGKWIKYFAGDDVLLPNCIDDDFSYCIEHPNTDILFTGMIGFGSTRPESVISKKIYFEHLSSRQLFLHLLAQNFLPAPSTFFKRELYDKLEGFDETIPMIEDRPFYLKALSRGFKLSYMDKPTVKYRIGDQSISQNGGTESYRKSKKLMLCSFLELIRGNRFLWSHLKEVYKKDGLVDDGDLVPSAYRFLNPYYYYINYILKKVDILYYFHQKKIRS